MTDDRTAPAAFSAERCLRAKQTVDERARHGPTLARVRESLAAAESPFRVFEAGPGLGATLRWLLGADLPADVRYRGLEVDDDRVVAARERVPDLARAAGYEVVERDPAVLRDGEGGRVTIRFETGDAAAPDARADLVVAAAFPDPFDVASALPRLLDALDPGGLAYLPVTFDGETAFLPVPDEERERRVLDAYHATMDAPARPGGSRSGRALLSAAAGSAASLVAAGGSDWPVHPPYPVDEA